MSSKTPPTVPIPIRRERSGSESSADSNVPGLSLGSTASQSPPQSPLLSNKGAATSPILSYFFTKEGAPKSPNALRPSINTVFPSSTDKDTSAVSNAPQLSPALGHHRSLSSSSAWPRFPPPVAPQNSPVTKGAQERSAGILRRLSLTGTSPFQRPLIPPSETPNQNSDNSLHRAQTISTAATVPRSRPHGRRATLSPGDMPKPRAPSPIGERMLKGHFDGFV